METTLEHSLDPGNGSEFNMAHYIGLNTKRGRVTENVFDETVNSMGWTHKTLHPRKMFFYDWERVFEGDIYCVGKRLFLDQSYPDVSKASSKTLFPCKVGPRPT